MMRSMCVEGGFYQLSACDEQRLLRYSEYTTHNANGKQFTSSVGGKTFSADEGLSGAARNPEMGAHWAAGQRETARVGQRDLEWVPKMRGSLLPLYSTVDKLPPVPRPAHEPGRIVPTQLAALGCTL
jgi:hypothetical protein